MFPSLTGNTEKQRALVEISLEKQSSCPIGDAKFDMYSRNIGSNLSVWL